jgi:AraC-like DNA-binding protein
MVSLYESSSICIESDGGTSVCRPVKELQDQRSGCGLTVFAPQAGVAIRSRAGIQPCRLEYFCLGQVVSGDGWFWTEEGGRTPISSRQIFFMPPGKIHDCAAGKSGMVVDRILFYGPLAEALVKVGNPADGIRECNASRKLLPVIEHASMGSPEHWLRAVSGVIDLLADWSAGPSSGGMLSEELQIDRLCAELKRKPEKWWDGAQMAAFCNLSEAHLRRLFKVRTGLSPKAYQDQVRVGKAEELLKNGFSVRMVSEILGYSDPYHFSRRFKSILGYPPRDCLSP